MGVEANRWDSRGRWIVLALFLGFLLLRLPFRAEFLVNWDAANFALGVREFDLEHHQPHPPGYIGYIALGRLLYPLTGDANAALTWISVVSGAVAPAGFFLLARRFVAWRAALASAVLLGLSPLVWYYSGVALTYALELALGVVFLWLAYEARSRVSLRFLAAATAVLVVLGAVRQSGGLLMTPLWLYAVWAFPWRIRAGAATALLVGNLAWLIPLIRLSGGVGAFFQASADLAGLAVAPTSVFALGTGGVGQNTAIVLVGLLLGVNAGLVVVAVGLLRYGGASLAPFRRARAFFVAWLVPALATYVLLHTGQLGYVLLLLPAFFLAVAAVFELVATRGPGSRPVGVGRRWTLPAVTAACGVVGVVLFLTAGPALYGVARGGEPAVERGRAVELLSGLPLFRTVAQDNGYLLDGVRQYDLGANDRYWAELLELLKGLDPERTVVLATPERAGSFRGLAYYLPDHTILGVGHDLDRNFGHLFTATEGRSDYTVAGLEDASSEVPLPEESRWVVVPDREVREALEVGGDLSDGVDEEVATVGGGSEVLVLRIPPGSRLVAEGGLGLGSEDDGEAEPALRLER